MALARSTTVARVGQLIKHIYEVDPLKCGKCGGEMKIISFIERDQRKQAFHRDLAHFGVPTAL